MLKLVNLLFLYFIAVYSLFAQKISIFHTTDTHGYTFPYRDPLTREMIGSFASIVPVLEQARQDKKPFIMLDVGDIFQGTLEDRASKGGIISSVMNDPALAYEAMVIGNHDFDYGAQNTRTQLQKANFTILSANLKADTQLLDYVKDYIIVKRAGINIGIFGLTGSDSPDYIFPELIEGIKFLDERSYLKEMPVLLREKGADIVILLSHIGLYRTAADGSGQIKEMKPHLLEIIKKPHPKNEHIDIIIDGHMHDTIYQEIGQPEQPTYFSMAGSYGQILGELEIEYDKDHQRIVFFKSHFHNLNTTNYPPSKEFLTRHRTALVSALKINRHKVAQVEFGFFLEYNLDSKIQQDIAGLSVAKSFYEYAHYNSIPVDLALVNHKGVRSHLFSQAGKITDEIIHKICPFENQLVYFDISGRDLLELYQERGKELIFYGGQMKISAADFNSKAEGVKPLSFFFIDQHGNKTPLQENRSYKVVAPSFLAQTGEFSLRHRRGETSLIGGIDKDAMVWYLQKAATQELNKGQKLRAEQFQRLSPESLIIVP